MNIEEIRAAIGEYKLDEFAEKILSKCVECINLGGPKRSKEVQIGESKIGGLPHVPKD